MSVFFVTSPGSRIPITSASALALALVLALAPVMLALGCAGCASRPEPIVLSPTHGITKADPPQGVGGVPDANVVVLAHLHVHVAGAVARPGVYRLLEGARACDALALAGGETAQAHLAAVNLASLLTDGQQLYIPTQAEVQASGASVWTAGIAPGGASAGTAYGLGAGAVRGPLDINNASSKALEDLPGIGPVLAARIVAYRAANGRYKSVEDLLKVSGIGPAKLADIRELVTVR